MTHSSFLISHSCLLGKQRELRHFPCDSIFRRFSLTSVEISLHDATHIFQAAKYHFLAEKNSNCLDIAYIYRLRNVFCIWRIIVIYITKNRNSKQIRVHEISRIKSQKNLTIANIRGPSRRISQCKETLKRK